MAVQKRFRSIVSAICYSIIQQYCPSSNSSNTFPYNQVVNFVLEQHGRMPDYLKLPIVILTLIFDLSGLFSNGIPFYQQASNIRLTQLKSWHHSPFNLCRDLMRFYESLTIFGWYSLATPGSDTREGNT
jgi:hypothetical protein